MNVENRTKQYQKNELEERVLLEMNQTLYHKELELISNFNNPEKPVIFIVGAQRSGTTLLMQLMIHFFELSYPNNFIARYWNVPYIGAVLYKSLSKNLNQNNKTDLTSDLGYTSGLNGPHEFGYFWKKWFPWQSWEEKKCDNIDYNILQKQLAAWQSIDNNALIFKNIIQVSFNIEKIAELFHNAFFIHIKRKPEFVVQSTYQSKKKLFGNRENWFGLKPPEYNDIKNLTVLEQITAQVYYSRKFIDKTLENKKINSINLDYENLVAEPNKILEKISNSLNLNLKKKDIPSLNHTNQIKLSQTEFDKIKQYCNKYFK